MLIFFALISFAAEPSTRPVYDLKKAIEYAVEHAPAIDVARLEVQIQERSRKNALARFFPSLDFTARSGLNNSPSLTSLPDQTYGTATLGVTENLYDNGQSFWNFSLARLQETRAEIEFEKVRSRLTLDVAHEFYTYSLNTRLTEIRGKQVTLLQTQLRTVESQYRQGMRTRRDYLRFKTQYQRAEIALISAENAQKTSETELMRILGAPPEVITEGGTSTFPFLPIEEKRKRPPLPEALPKIDAHFEARIARVSTEINEVQVGLARRKWLPNLTLQGNAGWSPGSFQPNPGFSWDVGVQLTYNLWDWGILRREWKQAELKRGQGNDGLRQSVQQAGSDIQKLMLDFARIRKNFDLSLELLELEEESYESLNSEYRLGRAAYLDLITALDSLFNARTTYANSYFSVLESLAKYHYHQGDLYEALTK